MCRRHLFTSIQHKFNFDICCCVQWISLVFLDAACFPDVAFHGPTEGRDVSSSCCATSLSEKTRELKYDVNFIAST